MPKRLVTEPEFAKIRLFVEAPLAAGKNVALTAGQTHYLEVVMRKTPGEALRLFNGRDGEWQARIARLGKRGGIALVEGLLRSQADVPDLTLYFAPLKRDPTGFLVEKATELGVKRICPVITAYTQSHHLNTERLRALAVEAAEQSWRLSVPEIAEPLSLDAMLAASESGRPLLYCDEEGAMGGTAPSALGRLLEHRAQPRPPWSILIGPAGGFSEKERAQIRAVAGAIPVSLGPRIMRAETAAIAAITLWQATLGDFG